MSRENARWKLQGENKGLHSCILTSVHAGSEIFLTTSKALSRNAFKITEVSPLPSLQLHRGLRLLMSIETASLTSSSLHSRLKGLKIAYPLQSPPAAPGRPHLSLVIAREGTGVGKACVCPNGALAW